MLDYDYNEAMLLKNKQLKKNSCLRWSWFMPINWNPFYDTSYDINQINYIHNIDVTLQLVSAQKDAYYARVSFKLRATERVRERARAR